MMAPTRPTSGSSSAMTTPQSPSMPATDRSKAPLMMTMVMPAAPMPMNEACSSTERMLLTERAFSLVAKMTTTATSSRYWMV